MRSLNNLQIVVPKDKLIIGEFYMLYTICPIVNTLIEWRFRFSGFNDDTGWIQTNYCFRIKRDYGYGNNRICVVNRGGGGIVLCYDSEILGGKIMKYNQRKLGIKLKPH